jgi:hypothetical protein
MKRVYCWIFGHQFEVWQSFGAAERIVCHYCGGDWAVHHGMQAMVRWNDDAAKMYSTFGYRIRPRS